MTVRRAVSADAAALAEVAAVTFGLACPPSTTEAAKADFIASALSPAAFARYLDDPARILLIAGEEAPFDGYAMVVLGRPADPDVVSSVHVLPTSELSKIYVREGAHGSGVAAALLDASVAAAIEHGAAGMWLGTNEENLRAQRFYGKHGFVQVGTKRFRLGDVDERDVVFERALR